MYMLDVKITRPTSIGLAGSNKPANVHGQSTIGPGLERFMLSCQETFHLISPFTWRKHGPFTARYLPQHAGQNSP